jgi:hypothetical protein
MTKKIKNKTENKNMVLIYEIDKLKGMYVEM